jgi:hypothetical protein
MIVKGRAAPLEPKNVGEVAAVPQPHNLKDDIAALEPRIVRERAAPPEPKNVGEVAAAPEPQNVEGDAAAPEHRNV